jgi:chromosome segregation ATPase
MALPQNQNVDQSLPIAPLLRTESADEFASLRRRFEDEVVVRGPIEQIYLDDFATLVWEIQRVRRFKDAIINNSHLDALETILKQLLERSDFESFSDLLQEAADLARAWFHSKTARTKVARLLRRFHMNEDAIEAEAFRSCAEDVERLDRMLTTLELRRDRALRCIADYRQVFSKRLQQAADRILENDDVPRLFAVGKRPD